MLVTGVCSRSQRLAAFVAFSGNLEISKVKLHTAKADF